MTATSRVPATIDALVTLLRATGITVWDGPLVVGDYSDAVFVGYDGDPDGDFATADVDSEWAGLGARARDEEFDIVCAAVALVGDDITKLARDNAYALTEQVETVLRANPSLGLGPPTSPMFVAEFKRGNTYTEPNESGYQVRIVFAVHVKTRI